MEIVEPGKYVELAYDLFEIDGNEEEKMFSFTPDRPDRIIFGIDDSVLPAFCDAIEGKAKGDTFDIRLNPEEAFGKRREEHVMDLDRELFVDDAGKFDDKRVREGASITMMTEQGFPVQGIVLQVSPKKIKVDFNHPLAGKTVHYKGEILLVRDATEKELHSSSCGGCGGCGNHDDGEGGCGGCGNGCCH